MFGDIDSDIGVEDAAELLGEKNENPSKYSPGDGMNFEGLSVCLLWNFAALGGVTVPDATIAPITGVEAGTALILLTESFSKLPLAFPPSEE